MKVLLLRQTLSELKGLHVWRRAFLSKDIALSWMWRENIALGNAKPIELCDTDEGAAKVRRVLSAIEHGNSV